MSQYDHDDEGCADDGKSNCTPMLLTCCLGWLIIFVIWYVLGVR